MNKTRKGKPVKEPKLILCKGLGNLPSVDEFQDLGTNNLDQYLVMIVSMTNLNKN